MAQTFERRDGRQHRDRRAGTLEKGHERPHVEDRLGDRKLRAGFDLLLEAPQLVLEAIRLEGKGIVITAAGTKEPLLSLASVAGDSLFGPGFNPDSLLFSPRTGDRFVYALNDTGRVAIYLLKDPNTEDQIGSAVPDVTQLNAASWE